MNKGFLIFSDEEPGLTMLKDEPEDLTHLAPTAGDGCVPLEGNTFMADMFDDLLLGPLGDASDPFLTYREDADLSNSPHLPALDQSPMASLGSPDSPDDMTCLMSLGDETDVDEELSMRAPYIPMGEGDDLPLLISADLLWGPLEPPTNNSCLEQLLRDEPTSLSDPMSRSPLSDSAASRSPYSDTTSSQPVSGSGSPCSDSAASGGSSPQPAAATQPAGHEEDEDDPAAFLMQIYKRKKKGTPSEVEPPVSSPHQRTAGKTGPTEPGGLERGASKRGSSTRPCATASKRSRDEGSGELLRHLMTAGGPPHRDPTPQSDSVLMNLLVSGCDSLQLGLKRKLLAQEDHNNTRTKSLLLDPDLSDKPVLFDPDLRARPDSLVDPTVPTSLYRMALLIDRDKHFVQNDGRSLLACVPRRSWSKDSGRALLPLSSTLGVLEGACGPGDDGRAALRNRAFLADPRGETPRTGSISLLDPDGRTIPSLADLSRRDCEVNAPLNGPTNLLQGHELLTALEATHGIVQ